MRYSRRPRRERGGMDLRSLSEEAPESQWSVPMGDRVGAEQLQQVPSHGNRPVGCSGRPGPPRSVQPMAWPPRLAPYICGIGTDGLRCATTIGRRRAWLRSSLAVCQRFSPTASWPEADGGPFRAPGGSAPVGCLCTAAPVATPRRAWMLRLVCAWCAAPSALGEAGARGRTPDQEPNILLAAAAMEANVTAETIHTSQAASRHVR